MHAFGSSFCFVFCCALTFAQFQFPGSVCCHAALLENMGKIMRQQPSSSRCTGNVLLCSKNQILPHCICHRIHCPRRLGSLLIIMHPNPAKIVPEARFHERADTGIKGLPRRVQNLMHDGRHIGSFGIIHSSALHGHLHFTTFFAFITSALQNPCMCRGERRSIFVFHLCLHHCV